MKNSQKFPGISRHAKALGVSHGHLYRVLTGERNSPDLKDRYKRLLLEEAANIPESEQPFPQWGALVYLEPAERIEIAKELGDRVAVRGNVVWLDMSRLVLRPVKEGTETFAEVAGLGANAEALKFTEEMELKPLDEGKE